VIYPAALVRTSDPGSWLKARPGDVSALQVLTELQNGRVKDILIACMDGLKGSPHAVEAVYSRTEVQLASCIWWGLR